MKRPLLGGCPCGAVRYELDEALGPLVNCHCRSCRHAHGAAFTTSSLIRSADLRLASGESFLVEYATARGSRFFCGRCGGRLFNRPSSNRELTVLHVASLDVEPTTKPAMHINVESKAPWYEILDGLPRFPGFPIQNDVSDRPGRS